MKFGVRKPNIKKSIKARTTGKIKRVAKSSINPLYGKKGMGYINDPSKAIYNKIYNKTTFGINDIIKNTTANKKTNNDYSNTEIHITKSQAKTYRNIHIVICAFSIIIGIFAPIMFIITLISIYSIWYYNNIYKK